MNSLAIKNITKCIIWRNYKKCSSELTKINRRKKKVYRRESFVSSLDFTYLKAPCRIFFLYSVCDCCNSLRRVIPYRTQSRWYDTLTLASSLHVSYVMCTQGISMHQTSHVRASNIDLPLATYAIQRVKCEKPLWNLWRAFPASTDAGTYLAVLRCGFAWVPADVSWEMVDKGGWRWGG